MLFYSNIFIYATQPEYKKLRQWCFKQNISASDITRSLATRNRKDFEWVEGLKVIDPLIENNGD